MGMEVRRCFDCCWVARFFRVVHITSSYHTIVTIFFFFLVWDGRMMVWYVTYYKKRDG